MSVTLIWSFAMNTTLWIVIGFAVGYIAYFVLDAKFGSLSPFAWTKDAELVKAIKDYIFRSWGDSETDLKGFVDFIFDFEAYSFKYQHEINVGAICIQMMRSPECADYIYELYAKEFKILEAQLSQAACDKLPA
jgi:hypothetical protein